MIHKLDFPVRPLGYALEQRKAFVEIDDGIMYRRCRVQLHGRGIVPRDTVAGSAIKTKRQQLCRPRELLVAEIDAKVGGFGIVPEELGGAIVSSHYFLFAINEDVLRPEFLDLVIRTPEFQEQVIAKGSTNYAAIRPQQVLEYTIPLPPISTQTEVVEMVSRARDRIGEITRRHEENHLLALALGASYLNKESTGCPSVPIGEVVVRRDPDVLVAPEVNYDFAGVYSFGRGVFRGPTKRGDEFSYKKLTTLQTGNFVYPKLMAWEGAFGVARSEHDGLVVSPEFPVFELLTDRVLPETMQVYFAQPDVWTAVAGSSRGTNVRRRRLHPDVFLAHAMPLPPMSTQIALQRLTKTTTALSARQDEVSETISAFVPSLLHELFAGERNH